MVRRGEIHLCVQRFLQILVVVKLRPVVCRDRFDALFLCPEQLDRSLQRQLLGGAVDLADTRDSGFALHDRHEAGLPSPVHRINLPVSDAFPALNDRRPALNHLLPCQAPPAVVSAVSLAIDLPRSSQVRPQ